MELYEETEPDEFNRPIDRETRRMIAEDEGGIVA